MKMLESLSQLDQSLFVFINSTLANPVTNFIMPLITNDWGLRISYALAMIIILWKGNAKLRWLVLFSVVTLALTDYLAAGYLKPLIARPRPCHELAGFNLLVRCGAGFSLPSAHTANSFGQALLFSYHFRKAGWYLYPIAILIGLSRVFVGVHYPGDVLGGAFLGSMIGAILAMAFALFYARFFKPGGENAV